MTAALATTPQQPRTEYNYTVAEPDHANGYLWPHVLRALSDKTDPLHRRVFDLGCGNGAFLKKLSSLGYEAIGVDPSESGVRVANQSGQTAEVGSAYDALSERFGTFPTVVSLEVVEHVYSPRDYAKCVFDLVEPGGVAILSTPFHGYWKNLAIALTGHFSRIYPFPKSMVAIAVKPPRRTAA
jgi:2-polyprenyl-3-methyl-5-hydroxy-6-metoxy-1,4-benzoquinol methylase